jgi:ubiquinone biosynthesis protein
LVFSLVTQNSDGVADALRAMAGDPGIDRQALVRDVERLRRRYYEAAFRDFSLGQALMDIFQTARRHQLTIPTEYFWIAKAAVTVDGVVRQLDPEFSLAYFGQSLIGRLAWARVDPQWWAQSAGHSVSQSVAALGELVPDLDRALAQVARGSIHLVLEHKNLDRVLRHWEKLANRLALSFLIAAVVLATAWVAHRGDVAHVLGLPLGSYAFLAVVAAAIGVIVMAVRRGVL